MKISIDREKKVTNKEFVHLWIEAKNTDHRIKWIANKIGVSESQVYRRAANLRKKGILLPNMHYRPVTDEAVAEMNQIITMNRKDT